MHNIYDDMLWLFLLSPPLLLNSIHIEYLTHLPIQILLPALSCLYLIIFFSNNIFSNPPLCFYDWFISTISSRTLSIHCNLFVFCILLLPFISYATLSGIVCYTDYFHGWCKSFFLLTQSMNLLSVILNMFWCSIHSVIFLMYYIDLQFKMYYSFEVVVRFKIL